MRDEEKQRLGVDGSYSDRGSSLRPPPSSFQELPHPSSLIVVWGITALLSVGFASLIVFAPIALATGHDFAALVIYKSFEKFCNQIPERSFYLGDHPFSVCARCTGIYFGFAGAVLVYPLVRSLSQMYSRPARKWLVLAVVPLLADFTLDFVGVWTNTHFTRALTGTLLGSVTAFFVVPALLDMTQMASHRFRTSGFAPTAEGSN